MDLVGRNCLVLDIETLHSASECLTCGLLEAAHAPAGLQAHPYTPLGWKRTEALGLGLGCTWDYAPMALGWFDRFTLRTTVRDWVQRQPLLVSFNGIAFDVPLLQRVLWAEDARPETTALAAALVALPHYDLLAQIWQQWEGQRPRGVFGLDALAAANGLPRKTMDGATAPLLLRAGRLAEVIAYNAQDVLNTRALFEQVCRGESVRYGTEGHVTLPLPAWPEE